MSDLLIVLIVLGGISIIVVFLVIGIYNKLVTLKNAFENAFSQIEVQLKRRYDLIPNLIETVKGYMKHERETLDAVVKARQQAVSGLQTASGDPGNAAAIAQLAGAEGLLGGSLGRLFALAENYPDLRLTKICFDFRKNSVPPKIGLPFRDKPSTILLPNVTPTNRLFRLLYSPACLAILMTPHFLSLIPNR